MRQPSPSSLYPHPDRAPRRRRAVTLLAALLAGLFAAESALVGTETDPSSNPSQLREGDIVRIGKGNQKYEIIEIYLGHEDDGEDDALYAVVRSVRDGKEKRKRLDRLRAAAPNVAGSRSVTAAASGNDNADALAGAILPNLGSVAVGWARGASNGFGASAFVAVLTPQDEFDNSFNGTGFALVKVGATSFFNDVVVTPHGIIAAGFGTNDAGTDGRLLFARFSLKGQKTGQLVVNVGPATDHVAELAYNRLRDIVYFAGHTIQADTFSDGLVGVLNPETMKLDTAFGGGDGMAQVNNPSGHAFFTSAELVANGLAACGVFGSQGMCHSFNYLGQTGSLWGPSGCLRTGAVFSRCDTDPDGNIYCAAAGGGGACSVCKIDPACSGAGFGPNGCQPLFPEFQGKCLPRSVALPHIAQPTNFAATDGLTEGAILTPNPSGLNVAFNDLVGIGAVLVGTQSKGAIDDRVAYSPSTSPCAPGSLCLSGNRFQVTAFNTSGGPIAPASAVAITADTGYFTFLNPNNVEIVAKVVNACGLGSFWVFAAGLTNQGVGIRVRDTQTGEIKEYINPIGRPFPPLQDTAAFATCPAVAEAGFEPILTFEDDVADVPDREAAALAAELERLSAANLDELGDPSLQHLGAPINLRSGRFKVEATFKTPTEPTAPATGVLITDETAYFRFKNPANVEVIVKIVNACSSGTPRFWVFAAGLTNVRVDITVTDTLRGNKKVYTNNQGVAFKPIQDVNAFATCP